MVQGRVFTHQNTAVVGLPIYLTVIGVVLAVALLLFGRILLNLSQIPASQNRDATMRDVLAEASQLYAYADEGSNRSVVLVVPCSMQVLVFGGLPGDGSAIIHDARTCSSVFYRAEDGTYVTAHVQARLCGQNASCAAIFTPGEYHLVLRLISTMEGPYVAIIA